MAARAIWKGRIRFESVDVPVKLFSAVQDRAIHFRLLDAKRNEPVKQEMVDPDTGDVVPSSDVRRAFATEDGDLVILSDEELAEAEPEPSRDIQITRFLATEVINHQWYDRPYFLGPDEDDEEYFALRKALASRGREGVARWVMRKKAYVGALRAEGEYLMLITLRYAGEVVPAAALRPPGGRDLEEKELRMAKQLVSAMEEESFDLAAFRDEYRDRVMELVEAKAAGQVVKFPAAPRRATEKSLAQVLEQSLKAAGEGRKSA
jgi:DNA end-binding protein Ku